MIRKLWLSVSGWVKGIFGNSLVWLKKNSQIAVNVTQKLKEIIESPVADLVTALIPGELDNKIKDLLRKIVPEVAIKVGIAHNILQASEEPNEAIAKIVEYLKTLPKEGRAAFWIQFAGELNFVLADGEITFPEAVALSQLVYAEFYKK
jgi:hypothetical protein